MRGLPVLLLAAALHAGEFDADTLAGMDAEVAEDWARAVIAFERAEAARTPGASARLRHARTRGIELWQGELKALVAAERWEEAAQAVAIARLIQPNHSAVSGTASRLVKKGVPIPDLAAGAGDAGPFPGRSPTRKMLHWGALGAAATRGDRIVQGCLDFLVRTQSDDGSWDPEKFGGAEGGESGVAALALLALLSEGEAGLAGPRGDAARRAKDHLATLLAADQGYYHYYTLLPAEAVAEYAIITGATPELRAVLETVRDRIVEAQNPGAGWRYKARCRENDTSLTSLAVYAIDRLARAGIDVPPTALAGASVWIESMRDKEFGQIGYNMPGGACARPEGLQDAFPPEYSQAMTSAGTLAWVYCGRPQADVRRSLVLIRAAPPEAEHPDFYYWHLGARAQVACAGHVDRRWYSALVAACERVVNEDGGIDPRDPWSPDGGRIYATATCALALAAPYREPPLAPAQRWSASQFLSSGERSVIVWGAGEEETGVYLDPSIQVEVRVAGRMELSKGLPKLGPEGNADVRHLARVLKGAPFGCLLGRIGPEGKPFPIEAGKPFRTKTPGHLHLLPNDPEPGDDGDGLWTVTVRLVE